MGNNLILPDRVTIQLINAQQHALKVEGVLFRVHFFARVKNDFNLQPFATNAEGLVIILRTEIEANIADHYATSLMDHHAVDDCFPTVEISMLTQEDISRAIEARKIWSSLLPGERERWASLDELLSVYRNANNIRLHREQSPPIRDDWDKAGGEYSYNFVVLPR